MELRSPASQPFDGKQRWLALFTPKGHEDRIGGFQPLTFWCDDVFASAKVLQSKGVEFVAEPKAEIWGTFAIFKDTDGNQFVLSSK